MKKKILIYNGQLFMGGIERNVVKIANELYKRKDVELELIIKENNPRRNVLQKELPKGLKINFIKPEKMIEFREKASKNKKNIIWKLVSAYMRSYERFYMKNWVKNFFEDRKDIDAVIDFDMSLGKYLDVIDIPVLGRASYTFSAMGEKKRKRHTKRLKQYRRVLLICKEMKEDIKNIFPQIYDKSFCLYNPIDIEGIRRRALDNSSTSNKEKKLIDEGYCVGISRLVSGKGRIDLVDIFDRLKKDGVKENLILIGEGAERENLEKKIEELGLQDQVFLLGQKENPYFWMKNAKLFLHTSYGEGCCNVIIESMACETPVISYACKTSPKELLGDGKYGWLVDVGDKESFKEVLKECILDSEKVEKKKELLAERVKEFDIKLIVDDLLEEIKSL